MPASDTITSIHARRPQSHLPPRPPSSPLGWRRRYLLVPWDISPASSSSPSPRSPLQVCHPSRPPPVSPSAVCCTACIYSPPVPPAIARLVLSACCGLAPLRLHMGQSTIVAQSPSAAALSHGPASASMRRVSTQKGDHPRAAGEGEDRRRAAQPKILVKKNRVYIVCTCIMLYVELEHNPISNS